MLAKGSAFSYKYKVIAVYGVISYDINKFCERMHSRFRVEQLKQNIFLGFYWLQYGNIKVNWVNQIVTL